MDQDLSINKQPHPSFPQTSPDPSTICHSMPRWLSPCWLWDGYSDWRPILLTTAQSLYAPRSHSPFLLLFPWLLLLVVVSKEGIQKSRPSTGVDQGTHTSTGSKNGRFGLPSPRSHRAEALFLQQHTESQAQNRSLPPIFAHPSSTGFLRPLRS